MKRNIELLNSYFTEQLVTLQKKPRFRYRFERKLSQDFTLFVTSDENDHTESSGRAFYVYVYVTIIIRALTY